jgi:hypothetical protein
VGTKGSKHLCKHGSRFAVDHGLTDCSRDCGLLYAKNLCSVDLHLTGLDDTQCTLTVA